MPAACVNFWPQRSKKSLEVCLRRRKRCTVQLGTPPIARKLWSMPTFKDDDAHESNYSCNQHLPTVACLHDVPTPCLCRLLIDSSREAFHWPEFVVVGVECDTKIRTKNPSHTFFLEPAVQWASKLVKIGRKNSKNQLFWAKICTKSRFCNASKSGHFSHCAVVSYLKYISAYACTSKNT